MPCARRCGGPLTAVGPGIRHARRDGELRRSCGMLGPYSRGSGRTRRSGRAVVSVRRAVADDDARDAPPAVTASVAAGVAPTPFLAVYAVLFLAHGFIHPVQPPDITSTRAAKWSRASSPSFCWSSVVTLFWFINGRRRWPFVARPARHAGRRRWTSSFDSTNGRARRSRGAGTDLGRRRWSRSPCMPASGVSYARRPALVGRRRHRRTRRPDAMKSAAGNAPLRFTGLQCSQHALRLDTAETWTATERRT